MAAAKLLRALCEDGKRAMGELWLVDQDARLIRWSTLWHADHLEPAAFEVISRGVAAARGQGLIGRVWASGEPEWITDITREPTFLRAAWAAKLGLYTAFAFPLQNAGKVVAVIALFSHEPQEPDSNLMGAMSALGQDIGPFVEKQLATDRSSVYFHLLVENQPDILAILGADGKILFENAAVERVLGYTPKERIGRNVFDFIHPDDLPRTFEAFRNGLQSPGSVQKVEVRARCKDGTWRWLETAGNIISGEGGTPVAIATSRDVTERKNAEEPTPAQSGESPDGRLARLAAEAGLSKQEVEVLALAAQGLTNKLIGQLISLSPYTAKDYMSAAMKKLGAKNRTEAVLAASKHGLL
jgi:PAS domain S-box-containing protein